HGAVFAATLLEDFTNGSNGGIWYFSWGDDDVTASNCVDPADLLGGAELYVNGIFVLAAPVLAGATPGVLKGAGDIDGSHIINAPIRLNANNSGGDYADGDGGSILIGMEFRVFNVTTGLFLTTTESGWNQETRTFS